MHNIEKSRLGKGHDARKTAEANREIRPSEVKPKKQKFEKLTLALISDLEEGKHFRQQVPTSAQTHEFELESSPVALSATLLLGNLQLDSFQWARNQLEAGLPPVQVPQLRSLKDEKSEPQGSIQNSESRQTVFVIHGRDMRLRSGTFGFLRSIGLHPLEWTQALPLTGKASPYIGEVLDIVFNRAQAVVVLLTPDDIAALRSDLRGGNDPSYESQLTGQPRPNVLFEAGMAFAHSPNRTILVEIGHVRPFSDIAGRHVVRMDNSVAKRQELATKLETSGCKIDLTGTDWHTAGDLTPPHEDGDITSSGTAAQGTAPPRALRAEDKDSLLADLVSELEDNLETAKTFQVDRVYLRPSTKCWKEVRNQIQIADSIHEELAKTYAEISRWLGIVESGISPLLGSMEVASIAANMKNRLPPLIALLRGKIG